MRGHATSHSILWVCAVLLSYLLLLLFLQNFFCALYFFWTITFADSLCLCFGPTWTPNCMLTTFWREGFIMLRFRKLHAIKYLYLYYQTNGVWVHIQLNGPLSRQKPVFSGKRVQFWGTGVPRIQNWNTCVKQNLSATEKFWPIAILLQAGFVGIPCSVLHWQWQLICSDTRQMLFWIVGDFWRPTDYSSAFILSISELVKK